MYIQKRLLQPSCAVKKSKQWNQNYASIILLLPHVCALTAWANLGANRLLYNYMVLKGGKFRHDWLQRTVQVSTKYIATHSNIPSLSQFLLLLPPVYSPSNVQKDCSFVVCGSQWTFSCNWCHNKQTAHIF